MSDGTTEHPKKSSCYADVMEPETRYARSDDVTIAYQMIGDGPLDLVVVPGWVSHLEEAWRDPVYRHFMLRLASFTRLIRIDRRGTGLSDRVPRHATLEQRMDDVRAVMDAVGSEKAALLGISEGGPMCTLFAATYPERTEALILASTMASGVRSEDYPLGPDARATRGLSRPRRGGLGHGLLGGALRTEYKGRRADGE